jgi:hypothetical protein
MFSFSQAVILATLSASFAHAFNPVFSSPRQCSSLRITWTTFDLPVDAIAVSDITMTLTPLDNDPARIAPQPYTVAVPFAISADEKQNQFDIPSLPFPGGTQFFASAYLPGAAGPVRRAVSSIFTVEHSDDSSCLSAQKPENRGRIKAFGKRQVNVIGTGVVDATQTGTPGTGSSSSAGSSVTPVVNVIGVGTIPATGAATDTGAASASTSAAASSSTGAIPPIRVIGTTTVPATATATTPDTPANLAPSPSSTGAVPPVNVIGTSFITATDVPPAESSSSASGTTLTVGNSSSEEATETSTDCTETPTETAESDMPTTTMLEDPMYMEDDNANNESEEQPCTTTETSDMPSEETGTETMPTEDASSPYETSEALPTATEAATYNTEVRTYSNLDEMVNAANSMFHAWNPYGPSYTAS